MDCKIITYLDPSYVGCYNDKNDRDLDGDIQNGYFTPSTCMARCRALRFKYAGVQATDWCLCGDSYGKYGEAYNCNLDCKADSKQTCGGHWANNVYTSGYGKFINIISKYSLTLDHKHNLIYEFSGTPDFVFFDLNATKWPTCFCFVVKSSTMIRHAL